MEDQLLYGYCATCDDVLTHVVHAEDPSACACTGCATLQMLAA